METENTLTIRRVMIFWLPLAVTWLIMAIEGPFLAAIIARIPEPKYNLAAYGVAFAFALLVESPIIMMMSASTALVKDRQSYITLRNYTFLLNILITLALFVIILPPIFSFLALNILRLPEKVASLTHICILIMFPWPAAIGFRRFYQGILIKHDKTRYVAYGTSFRLLGDLVVATLLYKFTSLEGAFVGATTLAVAVVLEAVATWFMALGTIRKLMTKDGQTQDTSEKLTFGNITTFYFPLALTAVLMIGINPTITFFLGWSRYALESLAVFPVISALVFIFRSVAISYQEVSIALLEGSYDRYLILRKFASILGIILLSGLGIIAFSPLASLWFHQISGLSLELTQFTVNPLIFMVLLPSLTVLLSFQRSLLVITRQTPPITYATILEIGLIAVIMYISITFFDLVGATAASIALLLGRVAANISLISSCNKAISQFKKESKCLPPADDQLTEISKVCG